MKNTTGFRIANLYWSILVILASCLSAAAKSQPAQESLTDRESKLIIKMNEHKRAAEQYVAAIKSLYARNPATLTEAYEKYLHANSKFNAFVDTLGLYLVERPKEAQSKVFKDSANETDLIAKEFERYARELINSKLPQSSGAAIGGGQPLFGPGNWGWIEKIPAIYKVARDIFDAEKKRTREVRVAFVSNMKQQTIWREWGRIDPAFSQ
ncbi:MAG TPA: hypothetical protein VJ875_17635 [Pyrinomonadaceae bacterium]|nr:hypothetical protein [Pyrinomonadaceae bacterium]